MKKKNLLTLGALCLSLGLVVSSCNPSTSGQPGEPGEPGQPGEPGKDGADGKTQLPIIVVNDNDIVDGTVSQDVYFAIKGEHDSVTFTFTPEDENKNIVIDFEINGEVVDDLDPTAGSYTISDIDAKYPDGIQVTGAVFTSVDLYGQKLLDDAVKEILKSDKSLNLEDSEDKTFLDEAKKEYIQTEYSPEATSAVQKVYDSASKTVSDTVATAKKEHKDDVKAQLEAVETAANAEVTKIQDAYKKAVEDAKVVAKKDLADLSEALTRKEFAEEDQKNQFDSFSAKIDAVTTIQGLGQVINGNTVEGHNETGDAEANSFYNLKQIAFGEITSALSSVSKFESELDGKSDDSLKLLAQLKQYGVDTTKLPSSIAEEHYKVVSATTEITWTKDKTVAAGGYTDLGKAGADEIKNSVKGIKDTLVANILAKYRDEINNSKALADQESTRTALLGVLETAVSNFEEADSKNTFRIDRYVSTKITVGEGFTTGDVNKDGSLKESSTAGLIGYIEYMLAQPVNGSVNVAFLNERIANAKTEAMATLKAARDAIVDPLFDELTTVHSVNGKLYTDAGKLGNGTISEKLPNPLLKDAKEVSGQSYDYETSGVKEYNGSKIVTDDFTLPANVSSTPTLSLDDWYATLEKATIKKPESGEVYGVAYVLDWATRHSLDFKCLYVNGMRDILKTQLNAPVNDAISESGLPSTAGAYDVVTQDKLTTIWTNLNKDINTSTDLEDISSASNVIDTADSIADNGAVLKALNDGVKAWLDDVDDKDSKFKEYFDSEASSVYDAVQDEITGVLSGDESLSDVQSFVRESNLNNLYDADVAQYLTDSKEILTQRYQNLINSSTVTPVVYRELTTAYNNYSSWAGHKIKQQTNGSWVIDDTATSGTIKDYTCKTIENVDTWSADALEALTGLVTGPTTVEVSVDESYTTDSYKGATWNQSEDLKFSEPVLEAGKSAEINVTGTAIVQGADAGYNQFWGVENADGSKVYLLKLSLPQGTKIKTGYKLTNDGKALGAVKDDGVNSVKEFTIDSTGSISFVVAAGDIGTLEYGERNLQVDVYDAQGHLVGSYYFDASALK